MGRILEVVGRMGFFSMVNNSDTSVYSGVFWIKEIKSKLMFSSQYFPEFRTVFKNWDGKTALLTLQSFPLPQEIVDKGVEGIIDCWKQKVKRAVGEKRVKKLGTNIFFQIKQDP